MTALARPAWSSYAVGAGIGALSWLTFLTGKKPLGITGAFESTAAGLGQWLAPRASGANAYVAHSDSAPTLDWEWTLATGVVIGSYLSAAASGERGAQGVHPGWTRRFGPSPVARGVGAFLGGALMMFGARVAKGCTSGHGISGVLQLAASSWLFAPVMATVAVGVARSLFGEAASRAG